MATTLIHYDTVLIENHIAKLENLIRHCNSTEVTMASRCHSLWSGLGSGCIDENPIIYGRTFIWGGGLRGNTAKISK